MSHFDATRALAGKVALVTGAGRGIGRAIAARLAGDGARVVVNYVRDAGAARETVEGIESRGGQAAAVCADVGRRAEVVQLFDETERLYGRPDIVVCSAGAAVFKPITEISEGEFDALFAVNVRGVFFALQEAARRLNDGGRIVTLSSGITIVGSAGGAAYAGTKGAVEQFTPALAKELGPRGITVNTVSPGMTQTDLLNQSVPVEYQNQMAAAVPLGRLGRPDDIAAVVAFLCGPDGRWVTGQNIRATGGAA